MSLAAIELRLFKVPVMNVKLRRIFGGNLEDEVVVSCWPFLIGRAGDCHLRPGCRTASRHHCALIANGDRVTVRDLGSRNGTFVNDDQVLFERDLASGDRLTFGLCVLEVVIEPSVPSLYDSVGIGTDIPEDASQEAFESPGALWGCMSI
jgi:predicted component of type VI protein secretion system